MNFGRLLYVGGKFPFCVNAAPYGFTADGQSLIANEGPGTIYPLIISQDQYAFAMWRVKSWRLTGKLTFNKIYPPTPPPFTLTGKISLEGETDFEFILDRGLTETDVLKLTNNDFDSVWQFDEQHLEFAGTYIRYVNEVAESVEAIFTLTLDMTHFAVKDQELEFNACGLSQSSPPDLAAALALRASISAKFLNPVNSLFEQIDQDSFSSGFVSFGDAGGGPIDAPQIATLTISGIGDDLEVAIFGNINSDIEAFSLSEFDLSPLTYYEYALNDRPALYAAASGAVLDVF
jgi:hypothetical protein